MDHGIPTIECEGSTTHNDVLQGTLGDVTMKFMDTINNISRQLAVRLYTRGASRADRQRGASALEYIVLAAAIIFIIGILAANDDIQTTVKSAFTNLFTSAEEVGQ